jgi:hypothetical protein
MQAATLAVLSAGAAALATFALAYFQRTSVLKNEHRLRAFDRHVEAYEQIFANARTVQDSLRNYNVVENRVKDHADPFLRQLLEILADSAHQYNLAVDWRRNSGMLYLELRLEEQCLLVRDLLIEWLSRQRVVPGHVVSVRTDAGYRILTSNQVDKLTLGSYRELRIETQILVVPHPHDSKLISKLDKSISTLIVHLKDVLAH